MTVIAGVAFTMWFYTHSKSLIIGIFMSWKSTVFCTRWCNWNLPLWCTVCLEMDGIISDVSTVKAQGSFFSQVFSRAWQIIILYWRIWSILDKGWWPQYFRGSSVRKAYSPWKINPKTQSFLFYHIGKLKTGRFWLNKVQLPSDAVKKPDFFFVSAPSPWACCPWIGLLFLAQWTSPRAFSHLIVLSLLHSFWSWMSLILT